MILNNCLLDIEMFDEKNMLVADVLGFRVCTSARKIISQNMHLQLETKLHTSYPCFT